MKVIQLFFPGTFEDAFLYRGRLLVVGKESRLKVVSLSKIATYLETMAPSAIPLPRYLFMRNDWLADPQFQSLIRNSEIANLFVKCVDSLATRVKDVELDLNSFLETECQLSATYDCLLDMTIYNGRIYLASDSGLFHCDVDWDRQIVEAKRAEKRFDAKCIHTSAKYGTVNISCGTEGLFSSIDEFDFQSRGQEHTWKNLAQKSYRSDWCSYDLVNYTNYSLPELFRTKHQKQAKTFGIEHERNLLTEVDDSSISLWNLPHTQKTATTNFNSEAIDYVYNANQRFFVHTKAGHFYELSVRYIQRQDPKISKARSIAQNHQGSLIKTLTVRHGAVIETFDSVLLLSSQGITTLLSEPVLSIRTFPQSKQYRNIIAITTEKGLWIQSVFDDTITSARQLSLFGT